MPALRFGIALPLAPLSQAVVSGDGARHLDRNAGIGLRPQRERLLCRRPFEATREPRLQTGHRRQIHVDCATDDAATLRSATVNSPPRRYPPPASAPSSTLNGLSSTLSASARRSPSRSADGRRSACNDQILTPRSTTCTDHRLHCHAFASPSMVAG